MTFTEFLLLMSIALLAVSHLLMLVTYHQLEKRTGYLERWVQFLHKRMIHDINLTADAIRAINEADVVEAPKARDNGPH